MGTAIPPPSQAQQTIEVAEPIQTQKRPVKLTGKPELIEGFLARFDVCISKIQRGSWCQLERLNCCSLVSEFCRCFCSIAMVFDMPTPMLL